MSIKRILPLLATAATIGIATTGLSATAAVAAPMSHMSFPATEQGPMSCDTHSYVFTGGDFLVVTRDPSSAAHIIANHVTAADENGSPYKVVGTETYNDPMGHLTTQISFVGKGTGRTDSVNLVLRTFQDGTTVHVALDHGTCHSA